MPIAPARALWQLVEPYHAVTYFTDEARAAYEEIGLRGFWRGYFAGPPRAARRGRHRCGRRDVLRLPARLRRARDSGCVEHRFARGRDRRSVARRRPCAHPLLRRDRTRDRARGRGSRQATDGCDPFARALFAANADLPWPDEPHLALWHACTLLREHRGDGHIAALYAADVDPCEAHVLRLATSGVDRSSIAPYRGWDDDDWAAAADRLAERGWLEPSGAVTVAGREAHDALEADTDRMAEGPTRLLGHDGLDELFGLMRPLADALASNGTIPYPNAIGVPPAGSG